MIEICKALSDISRAMQGEPCRVVNTFAEGYLSDLTSDNLNRGERMYSDSDYYFNRKWEVTQSAGYWFPLLLLEPPSVTYDRAVLSETPKKHRTEISCFLLDTLKNECYRDQDACTDRPHEAIVEDCRNMMLRIWKEFRSRSLAGELGMKFYLHDELTLHPIKNDMFGGIAHINGVKLTTTLWFNQCIDAGTFDYESEGGKVKLNPC